MHQQTAEDYDNDEGSSREVKPDSGTLALLARAEVDSQIATARAFPRSVAKFAREVRELVTMDETSAASCIYSLPRGKERDPETGKMVPKFITGPSVRYAEVIQYSFGNNRGGGRVVDVEGNFIIAQGVYHDLEKNTMTTMEVRRRITSSTGQRYNEDMITVTGNAAASIAHRNAILRGIPKALWLPMYEAARMVAVGDLGTLQQRRDKMVAWFAHKGVALERILEKIGKQGIEDVGLDELEILVGLSTALRDGSISVDAAFGPERTENPTTTSTQDAAKVSEQFRQRAAAPVQTTAEPDPPINAEPEAGPTLDHPIITAMTAAKKKGDLDDLYDRALAEIPKGELRSAIATYYDEQLRRIEREQSL